MPNYDAPGAPFRLGTLNHPGCGGTAYDPPNEVRTYDRGVHLCIHLGQLYAAWIEQDADGLIRGPYVAVWNGAVWIQLGGEIGVDEDGLVPADTAIIPPSLPADGQAYWPAFPTLASDGATLYLAYAFRVASPAPITGHWAPRRLVVRTWDGAGWPAFGEILPETSNARSKPSNIAEDGALYQPRLCASAAEPGVCYASFREGGFQTGASSVTTAPWEVRTIVVRFDGGSLAGTTQTIDALSGTGLAAFNSAMVTSGVASTCLELGNQSGEAFIFRGTDMIRWSDLAVVQTLAPGLGQGPFNSNTFSGYAVRGGHGHYYLTAADGDLYQVEDDGSQPFQFYLEGAGSAAMPDSTTPNPFSAEEFLLPDGPSNIWVVGRMFSPGIDNMAVEWYHHNCPGWDRELYNLGADIGAPPFELVDVEGAGTAVILGNRIYYIFVSSFPGQATTVIAFPILRGSRSCVRLDVHVWHRSGRTQQ